MTPPRPLLIASLPARNVTDAHAEVGRAMRGGADVAEVRFDRWSDRSRPAMADLFPSRLPLMATLRSRAEGGEGPDDAPGRDRWRADVESLPFELIDLEPARDPFPAPGSTTSPGRYVLSTHLPAGWQGAELRRSALRDPQGARFVKLVAPCDFTRFRSELLPAVRALDAPRLTIHTTGPSGPLLRAIGARIHSAAIYSALPADPDAGDGEAVEPSQIPIDELRPFVDGGSRGPLFAIFGHPIGHSLSPGVHGRWMRAARHPGLYLGLDASTDREFVDGLAVVGELGFRGLNVTHPWKQLAASLATETSQAVERTASANTLTLLADGVRAENTDLIAILRRLGELRATGRWDGHALTVVGSGATARSTTVAAQTLGADVFLAGRNSSHVRELARSMSATVADGRQGAPARLVVNATPLGRSGAGKPEVDLAELVPREGYVLDWVYRPEEPSVADAARARAAAYEDGLRLFVYQAAASYEIWWGEPPPESAVDRELAGAQ